MESIFNPFALHKYWASKPLDVAIEYISKYAASKKVLCDPFAGSGVFCYAGLLLNKKVVFNDLAPFALFLARNTMKPVDPLKLHVSYREYSERPIDRPIRTRRGKVILPKGTTVQKALEWFYESATESNEHAPNGVDYFIWDTEYKITSQKVIGINDPRLPHFLKICSKTKDGWKYHQSDLTENWRSVVESNRDVWLSRSKKKKIEPALVTSYSAVLVRQRVAERVGRFPIRKSLKYYRLKGKSKHALEELASNDIAKIRVIENLEYPYAVPEKELSYVFQDQNEKKPFVTVRPHVVFVDNESLSTVLAEDDRSLPRFRHYYTKRNLIALSILFWSIGRTADTYLREQLYYVFTCKLHKLAKFESPNVRWGVNSYIVQPNFVEQNVLSKFTEAFKEVTEAKQQIAKSIGNKYKETRDPAEFMESLSNKDGPVILWLRSEASQLGRIFSSYRRFVDLIVTDPPYVGMQDSIYYFELTSFYTSWLSLDPDWTREYGQDVEDWWKSELIQNDMQKKSFESYLRILRSSLESVDKMTTEDAVWIVTYHSASKEVFEGVRASFSSIGLRAPPLEQIQTRRIRATGKGSLIVQKYVSIGDDAYIVMEKGKHNDTEGVDHEVETERHFIVSIMNSMRQDIHDNDGLVDWRMFSRAYPDIVWKNGSPHGGEIDMKALFEKYSFEVSPEYRIFDRDLVGEDAWLQVYDSIGKEQLLLSCLTKYASARAGALKRAEAIYGIIGKLDGRFKDELVSDVFKTLFTYDWNNDEYHLKKTEQRSIREFLPSRNESATKETKVLIPEELVTEIERTCENFGHRVLYKRGMRPKIQISEAEKQFDLVISTANNQQVLISINNETAVRDAWAAKIENPIVEICYSERAASLSALAKKLNLIIIPHQEYDRVVKAFKSFDPISELASR